MLFSIETSEVIDFLELIKGGDTRGDLSAGHISRGKRMLSEPVELT